MQKCNLLPNKEDFIQTILVVFSDFYNRRVVFKILKSENQPKSVCIVCSMQFYSLKKTKVTYVTMVLWILDERRRQCFTLDYLVAHAQVKSLYQQSQLWYRMTPRCFGVILGFSRKFTGFRVTKNSGLMLPQRIGPLRQKNLWGKRVGINSVMQ